MQKIEGKKIYLASDEAVAFQNLPDDDRLECSGTGSVPVLDCLEEGDGFKAYMAEDETGVLLCLDHGDRKEYVAAEQEIYHDDKSWLARDYVYNQMTDGNERTAEQHGLAARFLEGYEQQYVDIADDDWQFDHASGEGLS